MIEEQFQQSQWCAAVAQFAAFAFLSSLSYPDIPLKYERNIDRNFSSQEERALALADSLNYSAIVKSERFDGSDDPEACLKPGT